MYSLNYRINYGNGQVSNLMTKAQAIQALRLEDSFAYIQTWDINGEWHRVQFSEKRAEEIVRNARHGR